MKKSFTIALLAGAMMLGSAQVNVASAFPFGSRFDVVDNGDGTCNVTVRTTFLGIGIGPTTPIDEPFPC
jgi:uncharacterized low-complexity protein